MKGEMQDSSVVEVRNKAEGNDHVEGVSEGPQNLWVHFQDTVTTGTGPDRIGRSDIHQFAGMAVCTADLSLRRVEEHDDGWMVIFKKE